MAETVPALYSQIFSTTVWIGFVNYEFAGNILHLAGEYPSQCRLAAGVEGGVLFIFTCLKHCDLTRLPKPLASEWLEEFQSIVGTYCLPTSVAKILELYTGRDVTHWWECVKRYGKRLANDGHFCLSMWSLYDKSGWVYNVYRNKIVGIQFKSTFVK